MGHFPAGGDGGTASVTGTTPIKATPTTGAVDVSWLPTGTVSMHTEKLSHLTTPTTATQAANKSYVDSIAQGLDAKASAVAVATANVASLSGPQTVDGVTLVAGNRVLLTAQTTAKTNGLWVVQTLVWTRPLTFAVASSQQGAYVLIEEGTVNKGTGWVLTGAAIVVGTTNQTWSKFSTTSTTKVAMGGDATGTSTDMTVTKVPEAALASGAGIVLTTSAGKAVINAYAVSITTESSSWTVTLAQQGYLITYGSSSAGTATLRKNSVVTWNVGAVIIFRQGSTGQLTVAAGATVTLRTPATFTPKTRAEYSQITAIYMGTNVWTLSGDLAV